MAVERLNNLKRTFGPQFPSDLSFLKEIMSPQRVSPLVLLALSMRMWSWLQEHPDMSQADQAQIDANRELLHRHAVRLVLPDVTDATRVQMEGIRATGAGERLVESAFEAKCEELYPDYAPLMVTKEWKTHLRRYRDALGKRPLAERRGRQPFGGTKDDIAKAFEWTHTAFESNARVFKMMRVLEVQWGKGRGADSEAHVVFQEQPLETLLREKLQREGRDQTVPVGGRSKSLKYMEISRLRDIARQWGYLPEEVDEALELLRLRQYVEPQPDGTIREYAGTLDAGELKHQASQEEERLKQLADYFPDDLRRSRSLLEDVRAHLTSPDDEIALDNAQRSLQELRARLEEFVAGKARELANQLAGLIGDLERQSIEFKPRKLDDQVQGTVKFVGHVDNKRKALKKKYGKLNQNWQQLNERSSQAQQQERTVSNAKALCEIVEAYEELGVDKKALEVELDKLQPYLTGLQHWREVVAKATNLHNRLDLDSPLRHELDEKLTTSIMEDFAQRELEALCDWERFKPDVDRIESELSQEENRRRSEFNQRKEQYEGALGGFIPQRMIQATFDPKDPEQSYQVLHQGVLRKLGDWLDEQSESAQHALSELGYLIHERSIEAENERASATSAVQDLEKAKEQLSQSLIESIEDCQTYCAELEEIWKRLGNVHTAVASKRAEKKPLTDEEKPLLEVLTTRGQSFESLRRQLPLETAEIDHVFQLLMSLYRKGHIEIEMRKRE